MDYEHKQREAFYLTKKYSSLTWHQEIFRLWTRFCTGYEELLRHPDKFGEPASGWWEENFRMFWSYAGDMEEGLTALRKGDKTRAYELLDRGMRFDDWLYTRRFEDMDLSSLGYRRFKADGPSEGIFADAEQARDMVMATGISRHTDNLRRDYACLPNRNEQNQDVPIAAKFKTPYGVPPGKLLALPPLDPKAPALRSGDQVSAIGIWIVEPDRAHRDQTYCMAYLTPWAPALLTTSEQEYESNSRFARTFDERSRNDSDKIQNYPVTWRLLWRDTRYEDGTVPAEEAEYLTYWGDPTAAPPPRERLRCQGGEVCPRTGRWFTPSSGGKYQSFRQGEVMPEVNSKWGATIWQLDE